MAKNKVKKQDWEIVDVKPSKIEGKGLFTKKSLKKGDVIGLAHVDGEPTETIGNYHNHSDNPNAESILIGNNRYLIASKNLKPNQEITVDYRKQPELEQPEDFEGSSVTEYPIMQTGGKTTRPPLEISDPREYARRAQAYQDSLTLYNDYNRIKNELKKQGYERNTFNDDSELAKLMGNKRFLTVNDVVKKSDEFKTEKLPRGFYRVGDLDPNISNSSIAPQLFKTDIKPIFTETYYDDDHYLPFINPAPSYFNSEVGKDRRIIFGYSNVQPVQPVIYQPSLQQVAQNPNPSRVTSSTTQTYQSLQPVRPEQTPISTQRMEGLLSYETPNSQLEFPSNQGMITRQRQPGERFSALYTPQGEKYSAVDVMDKSGKLVRTIDPKTGKLAFKNPVTGEEQFEYGGELPEAGSGYKVIRSNERKGKTHKVIGPDGTVKFFGDSKLGQHPKDPARKKAFYARHAKNLKNNPYFRAFARKTWEEGGMLPDLMEMAAGGQFLTVGGEYHRIYKNADGDIMVNHPKEDKGKWDTINLTDKAGAKTVADGVAATKKWHRENPYAFGGNIILERYGDGGSNWEILPDNEWEII